MGIKMNKRTLWATMIALAGGTLAAGFSWADGPATAPSATAAGTTLPSNLGRDPSTMPASGVAMAIWLQDDIQDLNSKLHDVLPTADIADADKRAKAAPMAILLYRRIEADIDKLAPMTDQSPADVAMDHMEIDAFLYALNDPETTTRLKGITAGPVVPANGAAPAKGEIAARVSIALSQWLEAGSDTTAQQNVVTTIHDLAKVDPKNDMVAQLAVLIYESGELNGPVKAEVEKAITGELTSDMAKEAAAEIAADQKLHSLEGKPLVIKGTALDGKDFTTADWKGSVILVDFWATWCGPCMAELPRVTKAYATFHPKGLQVLGVSNDMSSADLSKFLASNNDVAWPQLFDVAAAAKHDWNPITLGYGIHGIPTMFLIDKKGILRTVDARENFEELIPKMLDEPVQ
jgi:thiol-disulfide isomerase/thioredoxin